MRVLMTGMTHWQRGSIPKVNKPVDTAPHALARALREGGAEVEHRPFVWGEPLGGYDTVIVGLAGCLSLGVKDAMGPFDAIGRARAEGARLVFLIDDWRLHPTRSHLNTAVKDPVKYLLKDLFKARSHQAEGAANIEYVAWVLDAMVHRPWPRTIITAYSWGEREAMLSNLLGSVTEESAAWVDPSPFYALGCRDLEWAPARERTWVSAALSPNETWLGKQPFTWPLDVWGKGGFDTAARGQGKMRPRGRRCHERDLLDVYSRSWGVLSLPYRHKGGGWWRARYLHAAWAGAIVYTDPAEVAPMEGYWHSIEEIENASDFGLGEIAAKQYAVLAAYTASADETVNKMMEVVS